MEKHEQISFSDDEKEDFVFYFNSIRFQFFQANRKGQALCHYFSLHQKHTKHMQILGCLFAHITKFSRIKKRGTKHSIEYVLRTPLHFSDHIKKFNIHYYFLI